MTKKNSVFKTRTLKDGSFNISFNVKSAEDFYGKVGILMVIGMTNKELVKIINKAMERKKE